jgi:hypothetical protein
MSTFDKIKNMIGAGATGVLIAGLSGGISVPAWLLITAAAVQFATGATTAPMLTKSMFTPKADARGQVADAENPK